MGNTSSQIAPTQTDDSQLQVPETQETPSRVAGGAMSDATQRDESRVKKRRNASGDSIQPAKKSKKNRDRKSTEDTTNGLNHDDELVQATEEVTKKHSKKKRKREEAQRNNGDDTLNEISATQDSILSNGLPESTRKEVEADASKSKKSKRKKATGRPSGLNLAPAGLADSATQEEITKEKSASPIVARGFTAVNSSTQPPVQDQTTPEKSQKSKHAKRHSVHISPEIPQTQDSQHAANSMASPAVSKTRQKEIDPISPKEDSQTASHSKKLKKKKKRQSHAQQDQETEVLPTPSATQDTSLSVNDVATPPETVTKSSGGSRRKNMRAHTPPENDEDEVEQTESIAYANGDHAGTGKGGSAKKKRSKEDEEEKSAPKKTTRPRKSSNPAAVTGRFTDEEKETADEVFNDMMAQSGLSLAEYRARVQRWKEAGDLKKAMEEALPNRLPSAIRKFCLRRYHNLERGPWTPEQDEGLKLAYAAHPDRWVTISGLIERTPDDCKDRWRNVVYLMDTSQTGPWSLEDEAELVKAVGAVVKEMKKANKKDKDFPTDRESLENMISWKAVEDKLNGTRTAQRCRGKWEKLKKREETSGSKTMAQPVHLSQLRKDTQKLKTAAKRYNQCDVGDLYDILTEIHTVIPNHSQHYDYETTLWSTVSLKNPNSKFTSGMRRHGLYDALEVYEHDIGPQPTIAAAAKALADYLENQWGLEALREKRSYDPSLFSRDKFKSSEKVDSDDEMFDDAAGNDAAEAGVITKEEDF